MSAAKLWTYARSIAPKPASCQRLGCFRVWAVPLLAIGVLSGCRTMDTSAVTLSSPKFTLEQTERLEYLDPELQGAVTSTGIQRSTLADGRMQVVVNVRNHSKLPIAIQLSAAFKESTGFTTLDETPWQAVSLDQNITKAVRFVSRQAGLRQFTIRVRHSAL